MPSFSSFPPLLPISFLPFSLSTSLHPFLVEAYHEQAGLTLSYHLTISFFSFSILPLSLPRYILLLPHLYFLSSFRLFLSHLFISLLFFFSIYFLSIPSVSITFIIAYKTPCPEKLRLVSRSLKPQVTTDRLRLLQFSHLNSTALSWRLDPLTLADHPSTRI